MKKRVLSIEKKTALSAVFFLVFTVCVYAPFELYSLNHEDFWFVLSDFWYIPIACSVVAIAAGGGLAIALKSESLLRIYAGIVFGMGISAYIQGNFVGLKLGEMTGVEIVWQDYTLHFIGNLLLWAMIIVICVVLNRKEKGYMKKVIIYISLFLTAVQLVTLFVLTVPLLKEDKTAPYGYPTDKRILSLSPESNIVVFVLDKYDENFFIDVLEKEPEFKERLDGFTYYSNMAGCYYQTRYAVPFMLSGQFCLQGDAAAYTAGACENVDVYWDELLRNGYEMGIYTDESDVPPRAAANANNFAKTSYRIANHKIFTVLLYRLVMCKYFPDIAKPAAWLYGYEFDDRKMLDSGDREWHPRNLTLSDILSRERIRTDASFRQYKFIHISGAHENFDIDQDGNRAEEATDEFTVLKGSLNLVLKYTDQMQESGIYDSTAIIITADHGTWSDEPTNPIFLVKPVGARGSLQESTAPVSQADFGATVVDLAGLDYRKYGMSALRIEEGEERQRFYWMNKADGTDIDGSPRSKLTEYTVDSEDNEPQNFHKTGIEYDVHGEKRAVKQ